MGEQCALAVFSLGLTAWAASTGGVAVFGHA
jgi:hypothetical protein